MSHPVATYSFLPWLRQGLANNITSADNDVNIKLRAAATVTLDLKGEGGPTALAESISKNVELFGPGDILGIDTRAIVKMEPRNWITNYEPNYLPHIEFYDEDFPWRYTPAAPNGHRLRPWITLVVLREDEFVEDKKTKDKSCASIKVKDAATSFPPADQLWAWAHVHANQPLVSSIVSNDGTAAANALQNLLSQNPDFAYSRILCPRRLEPNTAYHAFVIPTFETGRLAGLGADPANAPYATLAGWETHEGYVAEAAGSFPVYHRWYFRTGTVGDFEYLVRLLKPKPVDIRVGTRDMDTQTPGSNLPPINTPADLLGFLKLGGALRVPQATLKQEDKDYFQKYEDWDAGYPHIFQKALAELVNLTDDYAQKTTAVAHADAEDVDLSNFDNEDADPDPVIAPPIYGRWHAKQERLLFRMKAEGETGLTQLPNINNWVHELNLDPRFRVPAGFGTGVVQKNQEEYMDAAWDQIGKVLEANRKIRQAQMAKEVSFIWHERHLKPLLTAQPERALALMGPVHQRVVMQVSGVSIATTLPPPLSISGPVSVTNGTTMSPMTHSTVQYLLQNSVVPPVMTSAAMRRVVRPGSRLMKRLDFTEAAHPGNLLTRINEGEVQTAPPKTVPGAAPTIDDVAAAAAPANVPDWLGKLLKEYPWIKYVPLVLALLILLLMWLFSPAVALISLGVVVVVTLIALWRLLHNWSVEIAAAESILPDNLTPEAVDDMPKSPDFRITESTDPFQPARGTTDSPEAVRFKTALKEVYSVLVASKEAGVVPEKVKLNLSALAQGMFFALDPEKTIPSRIRQQLLIPFHLRANLVEKFDQVMAYPEFDIPMYKPLTDLSDELFLPNINLIEQNSVTLLETNRSFIESYMVGLNHEFARELLWREYPTDQRGSSFRQFWDVKGMMKTNPNLTDAQWKEILRDISPIHQWRDPLGKNDKPTEGTKIRESIVLVVRGELLKKYPTAVIYAHKAKWQLKSDGVTIDNKKERILETFANLAEEENPPRSKVKPPLFEAKVDPDIYFFGFDLEPLEARGGTGETQADLNNPGWFFVIKERPGEPRFGLDDNPEEQPLNTWNDMTWKRASGGTDSPGAFIKITNATPTLSLVEPTGEVAEKHPQWEDDKQVSWSKNMSSADLAYVLFQVPVLVAFHAAEMLPKP